MTTGSALLRKLCDIPKPEGTDTVLVERALKAYRKFARSHRYGGMGCDYALALAALDAFERIMKPPLFDVSEVAR